MTMPPAPPNILLITSDQQHWNTLGVLNPRIQTPNLDRLCREGTRFSRAYCPNPTCTPTRASIITGMSPSQHGAWSLGTKLSEDIPTVGDYLREAGYRSSLIGKAHFQPLATAPDQTSVECQPTLRDLDFWQEFNDRNAPWYGFDHVELARNHADEAHVGQHYALWMEEKGLHNWRDYFQDYPADKPARTGEWDLPAEFHYSTWTAERTIAALENDAQSGRPSFVWASFHDPHPPYLVPAPWSQMYDPTEMEPGTLTDGEMERLPEHFRRTQEETPDFSPWQETGHGNHGFHSHLTDDAVSRRNMALYYGMTSFMDEQIGRILDYLESSGQAENTLVVFTSDHGHFLGQHGLWAKGAFHYEDVLKVPFLVRWPNRVAMGTESDALQCLVDLAPTFLDACGIAVPGGMTGRSQYEVWTGEEASVRDEVIIEFRHQPTKLHLRTLVTERYKLTVYRDQNYGELFDLQEDPEERRNRWDDPEYSDVKCSLFRQFVNGELRREPTAYARIAGA
jgi:arylsulfatase A-like enzyme